MAGARLVFANPALRIPMYFGWLAAFYNAPEGIAVPLARSLGGGSVTVGLVLAAEAFGAMAGSIAFSRLVSPDRRLRCMGPFAVAACGVLVLFAFHPRLPAALAILAASGLFACFQLAAAAAFVSAAPPDQRSQAFGLAQGGMSLGQGVVMVLAGAAAEHVAPGVVVAVCGAAGTVAALFTTFDRARQRRRSAAARAAAKATPHGRAHRRPAGRPRPHPARPPDAPAAAIPRAPSRHRRPAGRPRSAARPLPPLFVIRTGPDRHRPPAGCARSRPRPPAPSPWGVRFRPRLRPRGPRLTLLNFRSDH